MSSAPPLRAGLPRVVDVTWRVDVTLSTSEASSQAMRPSVLLRLKMDDGSERAFECGLEKFHELREAAAMMLNEMDWAARDVGAVKEIGERAQARWDKMKDAAGRGGASTRERARDSTL
jgi:hypothetical protein|tara:strand:- start:33144 stop:33500 length:357 start_codon:yes stop_codon:yes gene_type:complete